MAHEPEKKPHEFGSSKPHEPTIGPGPHATAVAAAPLRYFHVLHRGVGTFRKDDLVTSAEFGDHVDFDRLTGLAAVAEMSQHEYDAAKNAPPPVDPIPAAGELDKKPASK